MDSIGEITVDTCEKQSNFVPVLPYGDWSDIGKRSYMEDAHICIPNLAEKFGDQLPGKEIVSLYGVVEWVNHLTTVVGGSHHDTLKQKIMDISYNSEHIDDAMSQSEALEKINAKEELVKQHIKVAEEAISGILSDPFVPVKENINNELLTLEGKQTATEIQIIIDLDKQSQTPLQTGYMDVILCYTLTDLLNYYSQLQGNVRIFDIAIRMLNGQLNTHSPRLGLWSVRIGFHNTQRIPSRIYGRDPLLHVDRSPKLLFSTPRKHKNIRYYNQGQKLGRTLGLLKLNGKLQKFLLHNLGTVRVGIKDTVRATQEIALVVTPVLVVPPRSAKGSPATFRAPTALYEKDVDLEFVPVSFANGEHKSPKHLIKFQLLSRKNVNEIPAVKDKNLIEEGNERRRGGTDNLAKNIAEVTASLATWLGRDLSCVYIQGKEHHTNELASRKNRENGAYDAVNDTITCVIIREGARGVPRVPGTPMDLFDAVGLILNGMSDPLFDIYQNVESSKELWDSLEAKYMAEDASRYRIWTTPKGNNIAGPLVVNMVEHNNSSRYNDNKGKRKHHDNTRADPNKKAKLTCWKCGKIGHIKRDYKGINVGNKAIGLGIKDSVDGSSNSLKGHNMFNKSLQVYYVTYVSEAYFVQDDDVAWWVDSGATVHVCKDRCWFKTYESLNDGSILHMGNESTALVHGHGCVDLRLNIVNDNIGSAFMSTSKLNDSILWHARLGHVHFKRMQDMSKDGLIPAFDMDTEKCKTCMLTKITKKPFQNVKRETKVLELIHSDLCDLHATPSLGNKKYFVTFIDDASRFCYVYLLHTKDEALDKFKVFKTEVELQQGSLMRRFRTDRGGLSQGFWGEAMLTACYLLNRAVVRLPDPKLKLWVKEALNASLLDMLSIPRLLVPIPSLRIPNGTEDIGGSVGFKQKSGIDYFDTYAPVARISTIKDCLIASNARLEVVYRLLEE
ncbi:zinc finger, CCHC-type containing protein [Tanacetum coccineum]